MTDLRNGSLDHAKLCAACGIVWFHAHAPGAAYGYAGLAFFVIVLVLFTIPAARVQTWAGFARTRARRLLVPWLGFSLLYGAMKLGEVWATSATLDTEFASWMWLTGPALHLWFLPFAFGAGLLVYPLARVALALPSHLRLPLAAGCALLTLLALAAQGPLPIPLAQWAYVLPALCLGLALMFAGGGAMRQLALTGVICVIGLTAGWTGAPQLLLAGLALALCTALPRPATARSAMAARAAMTVYLLHPLVAALLGRVVDWPSNSAAFAGLTIGLCLLIAALLDGRPLGRSGVLWGRLNRA